MNLRNRFLPAVLFFFLPVVPLWRTVLQGVCIGPFEQIRQMAPWHGPKPGQPWDVLQADGVLQFFPWRDLVLSSWAKLQPPYWNPYELAGTPLLANSQSAGFYPPHVLFGTLQVPTAVAVVALAWFHLAWAGLGVYYLARKLGGSNIPSLIAGFSFSLSPFLLSWTALPSVITTVSWIPWCLLFTHRILYRDSAGRSIWGASLSVAMMVLSGHLQFAAYGFMAIAILVAGTLAVRATTLKSAGIALGALVFGVMIAGPQIVPVLQFSKTSNRQNKPTEEGYNAYISSAIQPFELASLANPLALGNPRESVSEDNPSISTYWPSLVKQGANFSESAFSLGAFVLALLALVSWKRKELYPVAAIGILSLLLSTPTPLNRILYFCVPDWSASGSPGRICCLFVLAACILVGTIDLEEIRQDRRRLAAVGAILLVGALLSLQLVNLAPEPASRVAQVFQAIKSGAAFGSLTAMFEGVALAALGVGLLIAPKLAKYRKAALVVPVLVSIVAGGLELVTTGKPLEPIPAVPEQSRVAYLNQDWEIFQPANANTPPNIASLNRIHELGGYDSLVNADTVAMLKQVDNGDPAPPANGNMMFVKVENDPALAEAGVGSVDHNGTQTSVAGSPGRVSLAGGQASVESEDFHSITIKANGSGQLTLRDRNMPGWTATIDGIAAVIEPGIWRQVEVTGTVEHHIVFSYTPPGLTLGLEACLIALILVALLARFSGRFDTIRVPEASIMSSQP